MLRWVWSTENNDDICTCVASLPSTPLLLGLLPGLPLVVKELVSCKEVVVMVAEEAAVVEAESQQHELESRGYSVGVSPVQASCMSSGLEYHLATASPVCSMVSRHTGG